MHISFYRILACSSSVQSQIYFTFSVFWQINFKLKYQSIRILCKKPTFLKIFKVLDGAFKKKSFQESCFQDIYIQFIIRKTMFFTYFARALNPLLV